uniref:Uncharacterized protein n=1 Tax=Trypanosoma congolense (strain IL3000) TaxID=1068625 RepID=G0ULC7_TRYCI|nr:conserved hypothetical protein [Trypanosoma congolense IL3000]
MYVQKRAKAEQAHGFLPPSMKAASPRVKSPTKHNDTTAIVPLHERPSFRLDLMKRSVFVMGLRTAAEIRELLSLMKSQCGIVTGAFRVANYASGNTSSGSVVAAPGSVPSSCSALSDAGGCVVVCLVFRTEEGALIAQRMDNTAQVFGSRFVVLLASRLYHNTSQLSAQPQDFVPQHERLWNLLFSPTGGSCVIDWAAAAGAVNRGEVMALHSAEIAVQGGVSNMYRSSNPAHPNFAAGRQGSVRGVQNFAHAQHPSARGFTYDSPNANFTSSTAVEGNSPTGSGAFVPGAVLTGSISDTLGRSNTLQQQYYIDRYETRSTPILSRLTNVASSLFTAAFGGTVDDGPYRRSIKGLGGPRAATYLRDQVEHSGAHPSSGGINAHNDCRVLHKMETDTTTDGTNTTNVYIPRMNSLGSLVVSAIPFGGSYVSAFLGTMSSTTTSSPKPSNNGLYREPCDDSNSAANRDDVSGVFGIGKQLVSARRKRARCEEDVEWKSVPSAAVGAYSTRRRSEEIEGESDERLYGFNGGLATLDPNVLNSTFASSMTAEAPAAEGLPVRVGMLQGNDSYNNVWQTTQRSPPRHTTVRPATSFVHSDTRYVTGDGAGTGSYSFSGHTHSISPSANNDEVREYVAHNVRLRTVMNQKPQQLWCERPLSSGAMAQRTTPLNTGDSSQSSSLLFPAAVSSLINRVSSVLRR